MIEQEMSGMENKIKGLETSMGAKIDDMEVKLDAFLGIVMEVLQEIKKE